MRQFKKFEVEREAIEAMENPEPDVASFDEIYDPRMVYDNPLKNIEVGMSNNWTNNLVPDGATHMIATAETLGKGVAKVADAAFENWENHRYTDGRGFFPGYKIKGKIGLVKELVDRFALGAFGEIVAKGRLGARFGSDEDEQNGIDLRKGDKKYQIKTGESFSSKWDSPEGVELIWIEVNGRQEVVNMHRGQG